MNEYDLTILWNLKKLYGWEENEEGHTAERGLSVAIEYEFLLKLPLFFIFRRKIKNMSNYNRIAV